MKKPFVFLFLLFLSLSFISAVEIDMKTEFKQGETLMAKISGNFLEPIQKQNIQFYRGHVKVPMYYDIAQINEEYYLYASLPETQNNYSLVVEDIKYKQGSKVIDEDFSKDFSITNQTIDFSITPGFVVSDNEFSFKIQNLKSTSIDLNVNNEKTIYLKSGDEETINFKTDYNETTFTEVFFSTPETEYSIPIYIIVNDTALEFDNFDFTNSELNLSFITGTYRSIPVYLKNYGDKTIANISLSVSRELRPYVNLSLKEINELNSGEEQRIDLNLYSDDEIELDGGISATTFQKNQYLTLKLNFIEGYVPDPDSEDYFPEIQQTCAELEYEMCDETEYCVEGKTINAVNGQCCLTKCKSLQDSDSDSESSTGKIIGWVIILVIIGLVVWFFFKKYKKAK